jgi:hypothetical protein
MNWLREKFGNLSITAGLLLVMAALLLLVSRVFQINSDALLSLISAIIGGLIATSSQAWVSAQDRQNQLRLAAIERRLEAHQQAYSLWRKLISSFGDDKELGSVIMECQTWWNNNCLYLEPKSRKAFNRAYSNAHLYPILRGGRDAIAIEKNMERIITAGEIIVQGITLPTIGESEKDIIK